MLDPKLLNILVCPVSKAPLVYNEEAQELLCKASGLAYPVRDGIPAVSYTHLTLPTTRLV